MTRAARAHAAEPALIAHSAPCPAPNAGRLTLGLRPPGTVQRGIGIPPGTVPFDDAAQAWFWTVASLAARHAGASRRSGGGGPSVRRPCDPDDVIRALDRLYTRGGIGAAHARVLRYWGDRFEVPYGRASAADTALWQEAMEQLDGVLRAKGLLA